MSNDVRIIVTGQNQSDHAFNDADRTADRWQQNQKSRMSQLRSMFGRAGREAGTDLGQGIVRGAEQGTDRLRQQTTQVVRSFPVTFRRLGEDAGRDLGESIAKGTKKETDSLVEDTAKDIDKGSGKMGDAGESAGSRFGGALKVGALAVAAGLVAAVAVVGVAAGAALVKGVSQAIDAETDRSKLAAQLGLNPAEAKRAGEQAGKIYAAAYGESLGDVNAAIRGVSLNIADIRKTSNADIQSMTKTTMDLASAFDVDVSEATRAVGKLIKTGLVKDATEGFDLITRGFQTGVDEAGDLLDTISEYSTKFRDAGIDGHKALGMMSQALRAGARDADTAADAIKEFAILSRDAGNKNVQAGFEALGLNAKRMFAIFSAGGPPADKAMSDVIHRLRDMKDPVERNATAVALFGTKAEDLGDALYAMDPTTAVAALGKVEGAAKSMGDTLGDTAQNKITAFKRGIEMKLTEVGAGILDWFKEISESPGARKFMDVFRKDILPLLKDAADWINANLVPAIKEGLSKWLSKGGDAMQRLGKTIQENKPELTKFVDIIKTVAKAFIDFATSDAMTSGLGYAIDLVGFLIKAIAALEPIWSSTTQAAAIFGIALIGMLGRVLDAAVFAFGWIPGIGPKLKNAQGNFRAFASNAINALTDLGKAAKGVPSPVIKPRVDMPSANAAERWLANMARNRVSRIFVETYGRESGSGDGTGRRGGYAHGGIIGAFMGGIHGGRRLVGEQGPELVDLPYGSRVHPAGTTRNMMQAAASGGGGVLEVSYVPSGDPLIDALLKGLRYRIRTQHGGSAQAALGWG